MGGNLVRYWAALNPSDIPVARHGIRRPVSLVLRVYGGEVTDLHVEQATVDTERHVLAARRIAEPASGRIAPLVVFHGALEHQDFLAGGMLVGGENGVRRPPDQGHQLASEPVQRLNGDALDHARKSGEDQRVDRLLNMMDSQ